MSDKESQRGTPLSRSQSPFTLPPARTRERTPDDDDIDVTDSRLDLPLDDTDRLREDAETLRD